MLKIILLIALAPVIISLFTSLGTSLSDVIHAVNMLFDGIGSTIDVLAYTLSSMFGDLGYTLFYLFVVGMIIKFFIK